MMGFKIALTGMLLATLLLLPAALKGTEPPIWFKAIVLITGFTGLAMVFAGALWAIWG